MAAKADVGGEKLDPNLTPLLDVVLQLIMFFMVCVNFASAQYYDIQLPELEHGQEIAAKTGEDLLVINIEVVREDRKDEQGRFVIKQPKTTRVIFLVDKTILASVLGERAVQTDRNKPTAIEFVEKHPDELRPGELDEKAAIEKSYQVIEKVASTYKKRESRRLTRETGKLVEEKDVKELKAPVIIRGDSETHYGLVLALIAKATKEGFSNIEPHGLLSRRR